MTTFIVLATHAAQCLGIAASQLNLPRVGDGVDADALWRSPRYAEVIRQQEALRRKAEERRFEHSRAGAHPELEPPIPPDLIRDRKRERAKARRAGW